MNIYTWCWVLFTTSSFTHPNFDTHRLNRDKWSGWAWSQVGDDLWVPMVLMGKAPAKTKGKFLGWVNFHASRCINRARVNWSDCCARRRIGRLNLVDPEEALNALLCKWVLMAYELDVTNLKLLLNHHIRKVRPSKHKVWTPDPQWILIQGHWSSTSLFKVWSCISKAWSESLCLNLVVLPKVIAKVRIWWLNLSRGTKELKSWQEINSSYLMAEKECWIWERLVD